MCFGRMIGEECLKLKFLDVVVFRMVMNGDDGLVMLRVCFCIFGVIIGGFDVGEFCWKGGWGGVFCCFVEEYCFFEVEEYGDCVGCYDCSGKVYDWFLVLLIGNEFSEEWSKEV